jgi:cation/acetate symporter
MAFEPVFFALGLGGAAGLALLSRRKAAGDAPSTAWRGLALAADGISAPFFLGIAGAVFTWGYDGLAFVLGLGAGFLLLQLLVAPMLPLAGASSIPDYFAKRYGKTARVAAGFAVVLSMALLLAAELMAAGLAGARLLQVGYGIGVAIAAIALLLCFALRGREVAVRASAILFIVLLVALLAPLVHFSMSNYGVPIPQIAYSNAVWQIQSLEETLLEQDLADPVVLKPLLRPFLTLSPLNSAGLVLALALGIASLPSLLSRHFMKPTVRDARRSAMFALLFVTLLVTAAPALAAYAKFSLLSLIGDRVAFSDLPAWMFNFGNLGLVDICGHAATDAAAVAKACAELPDAPTTLRLQDLTLDPDMITLAAPEMIGFSEIWVGVLAAAALAAALATAGGPLAAIVDGLGGGRDASTESRWEHLAMATAAVAVATFLAAARPTDMLTMATWALTLAAAGLFPALFAGLWWRRANAPGATAAIISGLAITVGYIVATHIFAVGLFDLFSSLSGAGQMAAETFGELKQAWEAAAPGAAKDAAWAALDQHAQSIANLWGIKNLATVVLALPVGIVALVVVSLLTPRQEPVQPRPH